MQKTREVEYLEALGTDGRLDSLLMKENSLTLLQPKNQVSKKLLSRFLHVENGQNHHYLFLRQLFYTITDVDCLADNYNYM